MLVHGSEVTDNGRLAAVLACSSRPRTRGVYAGQGSGGESWPLIYTTPGRQTEEARVVDGDKARTARKGDRPASERGWWWR